MILLRRPRPLAAWCARSAVQDAIVGGFFLREPRVVPLGELRTRGVKRASVRFDAPYGQIRSCVHIEAGRIAIAPRTRLPDRPRGDLLQAGPLLVADGRTRVAGDPEGFSAGARQFDSDITPGATRGRRSGSVAG